MKNTHSHWLNAFASSSIKEKAGEIHSDWARYWMISFNHFLKEETKTWRDEHKKEKLKALFLSFGTIEAYIEQRKFENAKIVLEELVKIYDGIFEHDVTDQIGHVRSMIELVPF